MFNDKPLAANGLISYRCKTPYGWCMIGAKDNDDALREAKRSTSNPTMADLQIWNGREYVPVVKVRGFYVERGKELAVDSVMVIFENQTEDGSKQWLEGYCPIGQHFEVKDTMYLQVKCSRITKEQYMEATKGYHTPVEYLTSTR